MTVRKVIVFVTLASMASVAFAQEPVQNISSRRHGNLAAAQNLIVQAYDRISVAQRDNSYDLGGHATKAKALLRQASNEIKMAAEASNRR